MIRFSRPAGGALGIDPGGLGRAPVEAVESKPTHDEGAILQGSGAGCRCEWADEDEVFWPIVRLGDGGGSGVRDRNGGIGEFDHISPLWRRSFPPSLKIYYPCSSSIFTPLCEKEKGPEGPNIIRSYVPRRTHPHPYLPLPSKATHGYLRGSAGGPFHPRHEPH